MIIERPPFYKCNYITFDFAKDAWQFNQYWQLRRHVFCEEQQIFQAHDRDEIDEKAIPIIAVCSYSGQLDQVVGVVRIEEREPGQWWGSRLAVSEPYRQLMRFHTQGLFEDNKPVYPFTMNIGGALIFKAVSTALALGCQQFFAYVQEQNVNLFKRMHWEPINTQMYHGKVHHLMQANLSYYKPSLISLYQLNVKQAG